METFISRISILIIIYSSVAYVSLLYSKTYAISSNETDRLALLEFKAKITADPLGVMSSWNETAHFCHWYGVTCGRRHQRVTQLNLTSMNLGGSISPHIGNLSFLKILELKNNSFSQGIPLEMGNLHRLQILYLYNNSLSGEIPSNLSRCSELVHLSLANNELVGEIPKELGHLSKLELLSLSINNITGAIPPPVGNLSSLVILSLSYNKLVGNIPDTLGQLEQINELDLAINQLSGTVPPSIFNLSSIIVLDAGENQLQGQLPSDLFITLPNLQFLSFSGNNQFTGSIPTSLPNASNLEILELDINHFTGKVPSLEKLNGLQRFSIGDNYIGMRQPDDLNFLCSLTNATNLRILDIDNNNLGGILPECISNLSSKLIVLALEENHISGRIPPGIQNLIGLTALDVSNNKLSGTIPHTIGTMRNLVSMGFDGNKFLGKIPSSFGNLSNLNVLSIAGNNLQGNIPSSLGNCKQLQFLNLSYNNLSGSLPPKVIGLSSLSIYLDLSNNQLVSSLPIEIGQLKNLDALDFSYNMLSGEIPGSLGSCASLEKLNMMGNFFEGSIPETLSSLRGLQVLDLSNNNLSGKIPEFFASFQGLYYLNLSYNNFKGPVPTQGVFTNTSGILLKGNSELCGGIPELHLPLCDLKRRKKRTWSTKLKVAIATLLGFMGAISLLAVLFLLKYKKKKQATMSPSLDPSLLQVSYQDLHRATNGFSSANLIGMGSFASVYRGALHEGEPPVAVKVLNLQHQGAAKSFLVECEALRNIRHRNLVKVVTVCSSTDYHGNDFKALVYELMPNGSLEDWLHPLATDGDIREAPKNLTLLQRLNIALDVASALEYLHYQCESPVIHCDLKPSNVLLNNELNGHVSDFGIAKFLEKDVGNNIATNHSSSMGVRGTIGYAAPEYGVGSEVSIQGDVYSYGILVLEMFTGKRPTDDMFKEDWSLHQYAKRALPDKVAEIMDPTIVENEIGTREEEKMMGCLETIIEIGIACSVESPGERMSISDVSKKLHLIKENLLGTRNARRRRRAAR